MKVDKKFFQKGLSLIELMVALAIGLILLLALASLMSVANRSALQRTTSELLDETARQVFSRLEADLYQAGYVDAFQSNLSMSETLNAASLSVLARYARQPSNVSDPAQATSLGKLTNGRVLPIIGCNQEFLTDSLKDAQKDCPNVAPTLRQSLQISYQAVRSKLSGDFSFISSENQERTSNSGGGHSCNGQAATEDNPIVSNRYIISQKAGEIYSSLVCDSNTNNFFDDRTVETREQPVVLGVEQMTFRYLVTATENSNKGERPDLNTMKEGKSVLQYLSAHEVIALPLGWSRIVGIEVCVVVAAEPLDGGRERAIEGVQPTVPSCLRAGGGKDANAPWDSDINRPYGDTRLYRRYLRTISIPNSLYL